MFIVNNIVAYLNICQEAKKVDLVFCSCHYYHHHYHCYYYNKYKETCWMMDIYGIDGDDFRSVCFKLIVPHINYLQLFVYQKEKNLKTVY